MAQITITYPDLLEPILQRAQAEHGLTVTDDLLVNWLNDRQRHQQKADEGDIIAKYKSLPVPKQLEVLDILNRKK